MTATSEAELRETITNMHTSARSSLHQIRAIATLALAALEAKCADRLRNDLAYALESIASIADLLNYCLVDEADRVGCYCADEAAARRHAARCR